MTARAELRNWGRGYCVVRPDPQGDAIDVNNWEDWSHPVPMVKVLAVCPTREAAEAVLRLLQEET